MDRGKIRLTEEDDPVAEMQKQLDFVFCELWLLTPIW